VILTGSDGTLIDFFRRRLCQLNAAAAFGGVGVSSEERGP